jgi:hypothetical protein
MTDGLLADGETIGLADNRVVGTAGRLLFALALRVC